METIVEAIDVGFGNTKHTKGRSKDSELGGKGKVICASFSSVAPQASQGPDLASGGVFQQRDTHRITVEGVIYEVGKDARLAQDASYSRTLDDDFCLSNPYMALVRGAIAYMDVDHIDVLVLGLPVHTVMKHAEALAARVKGSHLVPERNGDLREVLVSHVSVLPQPIGTFFDHVIRLNQYGHMQRQLNLVIDPGYFTFDWVVAEGAKMITSRSGATTGGMSAVLTAMAENIGKEIGFPITDVTRIDEAIRNGSNPRFVQREIDLAPHLRIGKEKARQLVGTMATKVGNGVDIDNIIIGGGGAEFFAEAIQEKFPRHTLIVTEEPIYSNVRGFRLAGEQYARSTAFLAGRNGR